MWNFYKSVGVLAAISVLIGFFVSFKSPSTVTETQTNSEMNETSSQPTADVKPAQTGQDPFKKFLDEKSSNSSTSVKLENAQPIPVQKDKDPFKEFLDRQKQNFKDQVVSPFGKN